MTDQLPSKDLLTRLRLPLMYDTNISAVTANINIANQDRRQAADEIERLRSDLADAEVELERRQAKIMSLRTTLRGIQSCSTCEACRGAATLALGVEIKPTGELAEQIAMAQKSIASWPEDVRFAMGLLGVDTRPAQPPRDSWDANGSYVGPEEC